MSFHDNFTNGIYHSDGHGADDYIPLSDGCDTDYFISSPPLVQSSPLCDSSSEDESYCFLIHNPPCFLQDVLSRGDDFSSDARSINEDAPSKD